MTRYLHPSFIDNRGKAEYLGDFIMGHENDNRNLALDYKVSQSKTIPNILFFYRYKKNKVIENGIKDSKENSSLFKIPMIDTNAKFPEFFLNFKNSGTLIRNCQVWYSHARGHLLHIFWYRK